jgi:RHS repeat-associated protein
MRPAVAVGRALCALFLLLISCPFHSFGQATVGLQPHGSYTEDFDRINLANLRMHIDIPLFVHKSRGASNGISVHLIYDPDYFTTSTYNADTEWRVVAVSAGGGGSIAADYLTQPCPPPATGTYQEWTYYFFDASGYRHKFPGTSTYIGSNCQTLTNTTLNAAVDGYVLSGSGAYADVTDRSGNTYTYSAGSNWYVEDSNGNQGYIGALVDSSNVKVQVTGGFYQYPSNGGSATSRTPTIIKYTDANGNLQQITISYQLYNWAKVEGYGMVDTVTFPDNSFYHFTYQLPSCSTGQTPEGTWGKLASVQLPTGGVISYQDTLSNCGGNTAPTETLVRTTSDGATTYTNTPSCTNLACLLTTTVIEPDGNSEKISSVPYNYGNLETAHYWYNASGTRMKSTMRCYNGATGDCTTTPVGFPLTQIATTTTLNNGQVAKTVEYLNAADLQTEFDEYDYGASSPTRKTITSYASLGNSIQDRPGSVTVYDGNGNIIQKTTYGYDEGSVSPTSGLPDHTSVSGSRGNMTSIHQQIDSSGSVLTTTIEYDDAGQILSRTDPNGKTTYGYDGTDTYATTVTPPTPSSGVSLATSATYDANTGLVMNTADPNGTQTRYSYDSMLRLKEEDIYDGSGAMVTKTAPGYPNFNQTSLWQYQDISRFADTETQFDSYGRHSRTAIANGQSSNPWYQQDTCYDANGNVNFQSYSYQGNGWATAKVCSGSGDTYSYDALGRVKTITHADGTSIQYNYNGRATKVTDENGVSRITQVDGLGRPTIVCEISSSPLQGDSPVSCGTDITGYTGYLTNYSYDLANHKTTITQGAQTRVFQTDWLGRTIFTQEPERGTTSYTYAYNSTGLVVTRKRPKANQTNAGVLTTTTTQYDSLGRVVSVNYDDGVTLNKLFSYDTTSRWGSFDYGVSKGRLVLAERWLNDNSVYSGTAFKYDSTGNVINTTQCLPSLCGNVPYNKVIAYTYDWLGNILSAGDGSSVTSFYTYTPANELASISSSGIPSSILQWIQHGPYGPTIWQYGNGLTGVAAYDLLGHQAGGWVCSGSNVHNCTGGSELYGYYATIQGQKVAQACDDSVGSCANTTYDDLNRLTAYTPVAGNQNFYTYSYDRYGNRWQQTPTNGGASANFSFDKTTNHLAGYSYDAAGNLLNDGYHSYTYDAEGNLLQVDGGATASYIYDAFNRRVRKAAGSTARGYVFDLTGRRVSIWDYSSGNQIQGQVYWGGLPIAFYKGNQAFFQHQDWLGSERIETSASGGVANRVGELVFGDHSNLGSGLDDYQFAGMDTDLETDSHHAQYRQYDSIAGRWMSPDPYDGSYDPSNPQSFNRYSYALNDPLSLIDPSGLGPCEATNAIMHVRRIDGTEMDVPVTSSIDPSCLEEYQQLKYRQAFPNLQTMSKPQQAQVSSTPIQNTPSISPYNGRAGDCFEQAFVEAGEDLLGISMLPGSNQDNWNWSSDKFGFVYTGAGEQKTGAFLSSSTGVDAVEKSADFVKDSSSAQGWIRQMARNQGYKVSMKAVSKDAAIVGNWAGAASKLLAAYSGYERYQKCRGN